MFRKVYKVKANDINSPLEKGEEITDLRTLKILDLVYTDNELAQVIGFDKQGFPYLANVDATVCAVAAEDLHITEELKTPVECVVRVADIFKENTDG